METSKMKSRKFWLALLGAMLPIVAAVLSEEMALNEGVLESVAVIMAYIFGQGYVDGKAKEAEGKAEAMKEANDKKPD